MGEVPALALRVVAEGGLMRGLDILEGCIGEVG